MGTELFPLEVSPSQNGEESRNIFTKKIFDDFWNFSIDEASTKLGAQPEEYWEKEGLKRALELFHAAAKRVPAYKDFLQVNKINPEDIRGLGDFKRIPPVNKKNYLQKYPLKDLLWDGQLTSNQMIAVSSGSSGESFFWPRGSILELETTYIQELYLKKFFQIDKLSTLYLDCFAMGMYIAGPIILNTALRVAQKGYAMTVLTPGLAMDDVMRIIPSLGQHFDQIVIAGYPPYVKDIIDEAKQRGIDWSKHRLRLLLAGEGYSEQWRDYVSELGAGIKHEDIINIYGTADASIVGHETPESITIRRFADQDQVLKRKLFGDRYESRMPTLVQALPTQKYFEEIDNELHFTATGGIPLIRYNIHDDGGVIRYNDAVKFCKEAGIDIASELKAKAPHAPSWKVPFVYLYGRSDFTVVLYGANVYPENIKESLETPELRETVTGRFTMTIERDDKQDPFLLVRVELHEGLEKKEDLAEEIQKKMITILLKRNDEYRVIYEAKGQKAWPTVKLYAKGESEYFSRGRNKQRWKE